MRIAEANESLELAAEISSLALPPAEVLDKTLRYETTIERQLYKAVNELERLQSRRAGKAVPASISLEFQGA